ncbi:LytTR family DNA-binding domain-containing protein [Belliella sp. DSM 111904]|uniref:LytTR family DNA-binding domain-containing protein n=1 Tax=Belliella filtrata TaxID=2923435 RepID=A0ABS9V0E7_9BACT|nr:LytTR family DNA-binding domain-containing protein [Belliella filtrata]MCH7409495.1 LytTR family DNA-binding domain-containing protein [Belliella filtrata]
MTKVLIIEDEIPARKKLKRYIEALYPTSEIMAELDTVEAAVAFLKINQPDLIFSDIELLDGNAFEIYQQVATPCPIIFTTAYDQFWMDAFEGNGIAYLLKPFSQDRFQKAWEKYILLQKSASEQVNVITRLAKLMQENLQERKYKKRFVINSNHGISFLDTANILFFIASEGVVFAYDNQSKKHMLTEPTLKVIEEQLDPMAFFRINRSELVHKPFIEKLERYNKNTLAIKLKGYSNHLITSQSTTAAFREWVEK